MPSVIKDKRDNAWLPSLHLLIGVVVFYHHCCIDYVYVDYMMQQELLFFIPLYNQCQMYLVLVPTELFPFCFGSYFSFVLTSIKYLNLVKNASLYKYVITKTSWNRKTFNGKSFCFCLPNYPYIHDHY